MTDGSSAMKSLMTTSIARRAVRRTLARPMPSLVLGDVVGVATRARTSCERCRTPPAGASSSSMRSLTSTRPDAVSVLHGGGCQQGGGLGGPIGLGRPLDAEPHARRDVDHEPQRKRPFFDEPAHEWPALASGHVPVDMTDIVARLVGAQLGEGQPNPWPGAVIGAGKLRDRTRFDAKPQPPGATHDRRRVERSRPCLRLYAETATRSPRRSHIASPGAAVFPRLSADSAEYHTTIRLPLVS